VETRRIGSLEVAVVGLGTNNFGLTMGAEAVGPVVEAALEHGINFFDTSDSYGASEERLAEALGARRDEVLIATKFGSQVRGEPGTGGARPDYVRRAADASLRRLGTDRIDLYQIHRPDPNTPIADTLGALSELVAAGKVREIGCSNFSAAQLAEADEAAGEGPRFVSVQNHLSLLERSDEAEVLPLCRQLEIAYLPFYPLANGLLTGKYRRGEDPPEGTRLSLWRERLAGTLTDATFDRIDALSAWARDHGRTILELAFAWLEAKPGVASVIAGATTPDQVAGNVAAGRSPLTLDELDEVDALLYGIDRG
jgi:aryl-alcohol dehydrogenase-like predicted oxidoreductase